MCLRGREFTLGVPILRAAMLACRRGFTRESVSAGVGVWARIYSARTVEVRGLARERTDGASA